MNKSPDNLIYGRNPVKEAIKFGNVVSILISSSFHEGDILKLIKEYSLPVKEVNGGELDSLCNKGVHQGIAAYIKAYQYHSIEEIIARSKKVEHPIIVMLDGINDPHNFGAILRCCDIFNVSGVIISKHNQVPLNATVAKTSAGAINYVPVALANNLNNAIRILKDAGFWIVCSAGEAQQNYQDIKYDFPTVLVVGNEGDGVSSLVKKNSDYMVKIPMYGKVNSLNASVAAGIMLARIRN